MNGRLLQAEAALTAQSNKDVTRNEMSFPSNPVTSLVDERLLPISLSPIAPPQSLDARNSPLLSNNFSVNQSESAQLFGSSINPSFSTMTDTLLPSLGGKDWEILSPNNYFGSASSVPNFNVPDTFAGFDQPAASPIDLRADLGEFTVARDMGQSSPSSTPDIPSEVILSLQNRYFDTVHVAYPMMDKWRFLEKISTKQINPEMTFLQYAMCAHAADLTRDHEKVADTCYQHARRCLHQIQEDGLKSTLHGLPVLQACILVALYEVKQLNCHRAVSSIGLVTWLVRQLWLHVIDRNPNSRPPTRCRSRLGPTSDKVELEERRRTFWVAYNVEAFSSVIYGLCISPDHSEIETHLPYLNSFNDATILLSGQPLSLMDPPKLEDDVSTSSFNALLLTSTLAALCLRHDGKSQRQESSNASFGYTFWSEHFRIDEIIRNISDHTLSQLNEPRYAVDANAFFALITLKTTTILLHQSALQYSQKSRLMEKYVLESPGQCLKAAFEIADAVRQAHNFNPAKMNPFTAWPIFTAAQIFVRALQPSNPLSNVGSFGPQAPSSSSSSTPPVAAPSSSSSENNTSPRKIGLLMDSLQVLMVSLSSMKLQGGLAATCLVHLNHEINGGEDVTNESPVGNIDFESALPEVMERLRSWTNT
ncbi:hypothetical protein N7517_006203 [Penicillium concentricum]|uniref:Xylanolytic transcriptional activator regulatory domain-containing protein n=1 Tax=Penicillium concentricum TaxID=293559 RepID=A0A9W9S8U5_9EURO|nr:uncharacterized protein N7517_006203 [Penicillium concentricum]KAJ5374197.1 hypothetical protein N7517_006203 [Penicillium concentricum]